VGKLTLDFAGTGRSPTMPETRKQSSSDQNQSFRFVGRQRSGCSRSRTAGSWRSSGHPPQTKNMKVHSFVQSVADSVDVLGIDSRVPSGALPSRSGAARCTMGRLLDTCRLRAQNSHARSHATIAKLKLIASATASVSCINAN